MYSNNSLSNHYQLERLSDDSEVGMVTTNMGAGRMIHASSNDATGHLDDYSTTIVNFTPTEILHHSQLLQNIKKIDGSYMHARDLHVYQQPDGSLITSGNLQSQQSSLPLLTPIKYVEYQTIVGPSEDQMIMNEDLSDKSDCESGEHELHKTPSKLPHKKRIAKKLNSSAQSFSHQDQFSIIMPAEESQQRNIRPINHVFECNICGAGILDQLEFFIHLKNHYEPMQAQVKRKHDSREEMVCASEEEESLMNHLRHQVDVNSALPEKLIESLDESQEHIKDEEIPREALIDGQIDEFNEFSEPEDLMMEDLRKEVEKVVETIADNECMRESTWQNYHQVTEMEETEEQPQDLQLYSGNLIQSHAENSLDSRYDEVENGDCGQEVLDSRTFDSDDDDEEYDKPLEQVRQSLQKATKSDCESKKPASEDDREDLELTECLKKIHNFKCTSCNKAFNSRTALGYHLKTHTTERRYVCDQCGKKFLTNGALKVHQRLHSDTRPYECKFPDCGKSFRQWGDLKYHETSIHSDKKDHVCEFCAKAFARKYSLVIHRRIHTGERNYKCQDCDKSFRASSYLLNHKRIHTGEKPYQCSVSSCQKKFRVVGDLKRHMKIHERAKGPPKDKKKEVTSTSVKKEASVKKEKQAVVAVTEALNGFAEAEDLSAHDECVDLSLKDEKEVKTAIVYNEPPAVNAKNVRSNDKHRKSAKSRKAK